MELGKFTKTPYLVLFIVLISIGVGTASALITITLAGNVIVPNGVVLTIPNGVTLDINFVTKNLTVQPGGGVLIQPGGKIAG